MGEPETFDYLGEIAVIGMAGRFPGAARPDDFWINLRDGVESVSFYTEEELLAEGVDISLLRRPGYVRAGALLPGAEMFDASFFGFTPLEAEITDPQHRVFLECAWEALENAGYAAGAGQPRVGVYAGAGTNTYFLNAYSDPAFVASVGDFQMEVANNKDHLATRASYKLNLRGPSISVQTGCSSSLVAVHIACQALLDYECDMALAGGVAVSAFKKEGYLYQEGGILPPDGHCRAFDAKALGTVAGNGAGVVALRRLADAVADGDNILAVIKGSAVNNDGALKVGYAAPSVEGQAEVIAKALALARVEPETVSYVEAHGTGTPLGDPIELNALIKSFRAGTTRKRFCALGSVKTNIGHLNSAAGVAGLIKSVLALKHGAIPPSLHYEEPNPQVDLADSPFYVNTRLSEWPSNGTPRRAGVSSFGIGGTNAHVILEEAPPAEASGPSRRRQALMLSARTPTALETASRNLHAYLKENPEADLADIAFTLQVGRRAFPYRRAAVCRDIGEALRAFEASDERRAPLDAHAENAPSVAFMFPGQGAQHVNMGRELYETEVIFRQQVDACAETLKPLLGLDLREVLYPDAGRESAAARLLRRTALAQPALFVVEYSLALTWMAWGVRPEAMIGHSIGEYVAACVAGVMAPGDALALVAKRAQMMQRLPAGAMLAAPLAAEEAQAFLCDGARLAAVNSPSNCVISGTRAAVAECRRRLSERGVESSPLHTSHAFHSAMMEPLAAEFVAEVGRIPLHPPQLPYISNLTGAWVTAAEATDPLYWAEHLQRTVRFADGIAEMLKEPTRLLLEVGPSQTLCAAAKQQPRRRPEQAVVGSMRHPHDARPDVELMAEALARLWLAGVEIDWAAFYENEKRRRLPLPTYPFERKRFWLDKRGAGAAPRAHSRPTEPRPDMAEWFHVPLWRQSALPQQPDFDDQSERGGWWLLFVDECRLCRGVLKRLEERGLNVVSVLRGEQFAGLGGGAYHINPRRPEDYLRLLEELGADGKSPSRIVHLWSIPSDESGRSGVEAYHASLEHGFNSLLFLAQALGRHLTAEPVHLDIISSDMQRVTGEEPPCPERAILLGPCRVIPKEYPNVTCRSIDVSTPHAPRERRASLAEQVLTEVLTKSPDALVALRGGRRWVRSFEPVRLERGVGRGRRPREGAVYLIVGLDELGSAFATHLAQPPGAKLVLVAGQAFPTMGEWDGWLEAHECENKISRQIKSLRSLEQAGTELLFFNADVTNREQMRTLLAEARRRFGEVDGVVYAAPIPAPGLIQMKTPENAARSLAPAVEGALVLESLLGELPLDFFVLSSSIASSIAGLGQVDECAASSFLDAYAQCNSPAPGGLTVSIDWGLWRGGESPEVAPPGPEKLAGSLKHLKETYGILLQEGMEAFDRILSASSPQVVVLASDFQKALEQAVPLTTADLLDGAEATAAAHPRPELPSTYSPPRSAVEVLLTDVWQRVFRIEPVGIHDDFWDLGGNSLTAIQIITRVREIFQLELPLRSLLASPTVAGLAQEITERQLTPEDVRELEALFSEVNSLSRDQAHEQLERELREVGD